MNSSMSAYFAFLAQQGGGAYGAGQMVGVIIMVAIAAAILWKFIKKK